MPRYAGLKTVHDIPPPNDYWTVPTPLEQGDATDFGLFIGVGIALSEWENLEQNMADLFAWLVESKSQAAARAYGFSISGKLEFIEGASEIFFERNGVSEVHKKEFKVLMEHKKRAAKFRNEIAHGRVIGLGVNGQNFGKFLISPDYNSRKALPPFRQVAPDNPLSFFVSKYRYVAAQITGFAERFIALRDIAAEYKVLLANTYANEAWNVQKQLPPQPQPILPSDN